MRYALSTSTADWWSNLFLPVASRVDERAGRGHSFSLLVREDMTTIDAVIPTWNSAHMLERTLDLLVSHLDPERIIIVDRHSIDATVSLARSHQVEVLLDTVSLGSARMKG
jgi:hypothetical protein